ncbi:hypothetical protein [Brucella sp. NBRC 113783]|uniref:hypothetical protein n=1 Tax=Brucella sp. NBRC 113783 TaxID=3075478 RepID=UPI00333EFF86
MLIVGFGALIQGVLRLGNPAQAVEKTGWLYQQFGDQGVAIGMIAMGAVALVIGPLCLTTHGFALFVRDDSVDLPISALQ